MARYGGMVRGVVASFRLQEADAADAVQMTWLRAFERLDSVRNPDRLGGWLATIANRECLALLRRARWETPDETVADDFPAAGRARRRWCWWRRPGARCRPPWPRCRAAASSWCTRCSTGRSGTTSAWPTSSGCRSAASGRPAGGCCAALRGTLEPAGFGSPLPAG